MQPGTTDINTDYFIALAQSRSSDPTDRLAWSSACVDWRETQSLGKLRRSKLKILEPGATDITQITRCI
jgi:hypothetical protein